MLVASETLFFRFSSVDGTVVKELDISLKDFNAQTRIAEKWFWVLTANNDNSSNTSTTLNWSVKI